MGLCEYTSQLSSYLDGELDAGQRLELESHLRDCAACDVELNDLRNLSGLFAAASGPFLSTTALWRFHRRISDLEDDQAQAERTAGRVLRITRVFTGIAACVLVAGSLWLARSRQQAANESPARFAEGPVPSTGSAQAPWDAAIQPTETAPVAPSDTTSPADATANWMIGGLVSSSPLAGGGQVGDGDQ